MKNQAIALCRGYNVNVNCDTLCSGHEDLDFFDHASTLNSSSAGGAVLCFTSVSNRVRQYGRSRFDLYGTVFSGMFVVGKRSSKALRVQLWIL